MLALPPPHLIDVVHSRAHVPFLLGLVSGVPVTYWKQNRLRLRDPKEGGGLDEGIGDASVPSFSTPLPKNAL